METTSHFYPGLSWLKIIDVKLKKKLSDDELIENLKGPEGCFL